MPFLGFFFQKNYANAFYLFLLAGFTDGLDGWLARHFNWQSTLGLILDPIADKLLIVTSLFSLAFIGEIPWWLLELVIFRDFSILLGVLAWHHVIKRGLEFKPSLLSKINTVIEFFLISYCLFEQAFYWFSIPLKYSLIAVVALTTTASYVEYMWMWARRAALNQPKLK